MLFGKRRRDAPFEDVDTAHVFRHQSTFLVCSVEHLTLFPGLQQVVPSAVLTSPTSEELGSTTLAALERNRRGVDRPEDELRNDDDELPALLGFKSTHEMAAKTARVSVRRIGTKSFTLLRLRTEDDKPVAYGAEEATLEIEANVERELGEAIEALLDSNEQP